MSAFPLELLAILIAGGMAQAVLLVVLQGLYLKRSSIGVRLEALRTEVATRDRDIRVWVKDSLAQIEADSITRDTDIRRDLMTTRAEIVQCVGEAMTDEANLKRVAEYTAGAIMERLLDSKQVRREAALLAESEDQKRTRQRRERGGTDGT